MKKTRLKKQSTKGLKAIETKLDREYQNEIRLICEMFGIKSEYSGLKMEVSHHAREKSRSAVLRYNLIDFIPLTTNEHAEHHLSKGDSKIMNRIYLKRGVEWAKEIEKLGNQTISKDWKYYSDARCQLEWIKEHRKEVAEAYKKYGYFNVVNK